MRGRPRLPRSLACATVLLAVASLPPAHGIAPANKVRYRLVSLGIPDTVRMNEFLWESTALGINQRGDVVGHFQQPDDMVHERAFIWLLDPAHGLPAGLHDVNDVFGMPLDTPTAANDVNQDYILVGRTGQSTTSTAQVWLLSDIPASPLPIGTGEAFAINREWPEKPVIVGGLELPQACGCGTRPVDGLRGFRVELNHAPPWFEPIEVLLPQVPDEEESIAFDVSREARAVGRSDACPDPMCVVPISCMSHDDHSALVWAAGLQDPIELRTLGNGSQANGINDLPLNQMVGFSHERNCPQRAVVWDPAGGISPRQVLPCAGSTAEANKINNHEDVVGWCEIQGQTLAHLWERDDDSWLDVDLNTAIHPNLDWDLEVAHDINDAGWIVGHGTPPPLETGGAFLLIPLGSCPEDVNQDGVVDETDLFLVRVAWGPCPPADPCFEDVDGSGVVDVEDLTAVVLSFGSCPTTH